MGKKSKNLLVFISVIILLAVGTFLMLKKLNVEEPIKEENAEKITTVSDSSQTYTLSGKKWQMQPFLTLDEEYTVYESQFIGLNEPWMFEGYEITVESAEISDTCFRQEDEKALRDMGEKWLSCICVPIDMGFPGYKEEVKFVTIKYTIQNKSAKNDGFRLWDVLEPVLMLQTGERIEGFDYYPEIGEAYKTREGIYEDMLWETGDIDSIILEQGDMVELEQVFAVGKYKIPEDGKLLFFEGSRRNIKESCVVDLDISVQKTEDSLVDFTETETESGETKLVTSRSLYLNNRQLTELYGDSCLMFPKRLLLEAEKDQCSYSTDAGDVTIKITEGKWLDSWEELPDYFQDSAYVASVRDAYLEQGASEEDIRYLLLTGEYSYCEPQDGDDDCNFQFKPCLSTYLFAASGSEQAEYCELRMRGLPDDYYLVSSKGQTRETTAWKTESSICLEEDKDEAVIQYVFVLIKEKDDKEYCFIQNSYLGLFHSNAIVLKEEETYFPQYTGQEVIAFRIKGEGMDGV